MPKIVDPDERREAVADAVLRVAERDGVGRASLRSVAAAAELNIGSVRHYFAGHHELLRFAMRSIIDRTTARLEQRRDAVLARPSVSDEEALTRRAETLAELLPLDATRRRENAVLLEFMVAARTDEGLADLAHEAAEGVAALARLVLTAGGVEDLDREVGRLAALIDGVGQRCLLHPELLAPDEAVAVLRVHLASLERAADQGRG